MTNANLVSNPELSSILSIKFNHFNNLNQLYINAGLIGDDGCPRIQGNLFICPEIRQPTRYYNTLYRKGFRIPNIKEGMVIIERLKRMIDVTYPDYLDDFKDQLNCLYQSLTEDSFFREFWCFEENSVLLGLHGTKEANLTSIAWEIHVKGSL